MRGTAYPAVRRAVILAIVAASLPACGGSDGPAGAPGPSLPVIQSLSATGLPAAPGGAVTVTVQAQSAGGLALSYAWAVSGAGWSIASGGNTATVTLNAPSAYAAAGSATVTVTDTASQVGTGLASLTTIGNSAPIIHTLSAAPNPMTLAGTMTASVTASDPNGDSLAYTWTVPSGFSIASGQGTAQITVSSSAPSTGTISVSVSDGAAPAVQGSLSANSRHGWGLSVPIEASAAALNQPPKVAMNLAGEAMAVWVQSDGVAPSVWAARYTPAGGWAAPAGVESAAPTADFPDVVLDASGNAVAVWAQSDGVAESVWANRFTPGGGWGTPVALEASAEPFSTHQVAGDASGNAVVTWSQSDGSVSRIWANRFTPGGGWAGAEIVDLDPATAATSPGVAMNASGNIVVVWKQTDMRARFCTGGVWDVAAPVMGTGASGVSTSVALNAGGAAVAVWNVAFSGDTRRRTNRFVPGSGWQADEFVDSDGAPTFVLPQFNTHRVVLDDFGYGMAVWSQPDDLSVSVRVWANRLTPVGWSGPVLLQTEGGTGLLPAVAVDPVGNTVAVWTQNSTQVASRWFTPAGGWEEVEILAAGSSPHVAMGDVGVATAVFSSGDDARAVHRR